MLWVVQPAYRNKRLQQTYDRLREDVQDRPLVLILDEVDQLHDPGVVYELLRMETVAIICVPIRDDEFFAEVDPRIASRLRSGQSIEFVLYSLDELADTSVTVRMPASGLVP